jgi:hypothetical protein
LWQSRQARLALPIPAPLPEILMPSTAVSRSPLTIMPVFPRGQASAGNTGNRQGSSRMAQSTANRAGIKRNAARLRALRRRAAAWKRAARRAMTLAVVAGSLLGPVHESRAQMGMGQSGMGQAGGLVNGAVTRLQNGPGWMYYGINAADRGLGYLGSYMTAGGFIPVAEDDLGGLWSTDLRGHLSNYGGFFSNVGAVRKQFIGGTLLGVGVYWDYDGDQNQYSPTPIPVGMGNVYSFSGGQSYNQVGVSGEWLTDFGNLRSNGYIPVGTTAQLTGPFVGNSVLCQNGVNAALGGADLEVGAYIPGLSDWAGMVSVGGYAYGNDRYKFQDGSAAVPWFGGVYTRLDMTFIKNWDFSLQYNNDSYFDSTGFARLTYRMGGSRRRNVPDQVEQPMMRNEHIVRARQVPEVALNETTGDAWQVFHVDNSAIPGGAGTAEAPFTTLAEAQAAAVTAYDIVYVHVGNSATAPYFTPATGYTFANTNQYLIGEGSTLAIPTLSCGPKQFFTGNGSSLYPQISNPLGAAIAVNQAGTQVSHFQITGSPVGISDGGGIAAPDVAMISDIIIQGSPGLATRGIDITKSTGTFNLDNVRLTGLTNSGVAVSSAATVNLSNSSLTDVQGTGVLASGANATVNVSTSTIQGTAGNAIEARGASSRIVLTSGTIENTTENAVVASGLSAVVNVNDSRIVRTTGSALATTVGGVKSSITTSDVEILTVGDSGPAIDLQGNESAITLNLTKVSGVGGVGARVRAARSTFTMQQQSRMSGVGSDGISVENVDGFARVLDGSSITNAAGSGIVSTGGAVQVVESTIDTVGASGILATGVAGATTNPNIPSGGLRAVWVQGATIRNAQTAGISVTDSNLRVERADATSTRSRQTSISNTGDYGIQVVANNPGPAPNLSFQALVDSAIISGVDNGIVVTANDGPGLPTIDFTARNNSITTNGAGAGINVSAEWEAAPAYPGTQLSAVNAVIVGNNISTGGDEDILLTTVGGPLQFAAPGGGVIITPNNVRPISIAAGSVGNLEGLNNGANVVDEPAGVTPGINIDFNPGLTVPQPPPAPPVP